MNGALHNSTDPMTKTLLGVAWVFALVSALTISILPTILGSIASIMVMYKTWLEIKKIKSRKE